MKLTSYEEFSKNHKTWSEDARKKVKFPFTSVIEGCYPESDNAIYWCWQQFGPKDGMCNETGSQHPACPVVLATEYIKKYTYEGVEEEEKCYNEVEEHGHLGIWTTVWLGKTGYDYGFTEFYFLNEADKIKFDETVLILGFGEKYDY